jgi:carnitine 3-dehydrogenase
MERQVNFCTEKMMPRTLKDAALAPQEVKTIGLVGMGSVGAGWATVYLARGYKVLAFDPAPQAEVATVRFLGDSWPAVRDLGLTGAARPPADNLRFVSLPEVAAGADIVHENVPEDADLKRSALAEIEAAAALETVICSSSGGLKPSDLQRDMIAPERFVIVHPFNPPHLIPLVEVIGGKRTAAETVDWTIDLMRQIGKRPIKLDREMTAYLANRLQFALLREAIHCLAEGVASARSIDDAVRYALAPRWLVMGALMTFSLAGGPGGMSDLLDKFGASTEEWWADLGAPHLTPEVRQKLVAAGDALAAGRSLSEWIAYRDKRLVELFTALRDGGELSD